MANPFNLAKWKHTNPPPNPIPDDADDAIEIGNVNTLVGAKLQDDEVCTTIVANAANENAAFMAVNEGGGVGVVGLYGESDSLGPGSTGVVGSGKWGVAGVASSSSVDITDELLPSHIGVLGVGHDRGVFGNGLVGVEGDSFVTGPAGEVVGTGVLGLSAQGIGVAGQSIGGVNAAKAPVPPYVGVLGVAQPLQQVSPSSPIEPDYIGAGVVGVGFVHGGVFQATPDEVAQTFSNVHLTPIERGYSNLKTNPAPAPNQFAPQLPRLGTPGDLVAISPGVGPGTDPVQLWFCIRAADRIAGATWARISFDGVVRHP